MQYRKPKQSRTLATDPAQLMPPGPDTRITALKPIGTDGATVAIMVERTRVAKVETVWALDLGIRIDTPWTEELAAQVFTAAKSHAALQHAIRLLGTGQRTAYALTRKLKMSGHAESDAKAAVEKLQRLGLIDDTALADRLADELARSGKLGKRGIELKLRTRGIASDLAKKASREAIEESGDPDAALTLAHKRAARMTNLEPLVARRRLYGFLLRRGFDHDQARKATDSALAAVASDDLQ